MSGGGVGQILGLYRSILKIHRAKLPVPMREMGDRYVKEEFGAHLKGKTTKDQWEMFVQEWYRYRSMLMGTSDLAPNGTVLDKETLITGIDRSGDISEEMIAQMSPDQVARLQKMRAEAVKFGKEISS